MDLLGYVGDGLGGDDVSQAPSGDGVGLGEAAAADGPLEHPRQGGEVGVEVWGVDDVFVDFVGDDVGVVLFGKLGDEFELLGGEYLSGGVGGVAEDEVCCEFSGPPIKFKCNSQYLVSQIEAAGNLVKIEFGNADDGSEPIRLASSDNVGYEGVLMGMRF